MPEFIYQMHAVRKAHGDKVIFDNVTLAFLPGAKIGVVGPNGTGKSTLLRMMAGVEQPSNGEARLMPGFSVGLLDQEPQLDESKTVLGNVEEGVAATKALLDRYNEIAEQMATDYSDELLEEMGQLQEQLDHSNAWDLESQLDPSRRWARRARAAQAAVRSTAWRSTSGVDGSGGQTSRTIWMSAPSSSWTATAFSGVNRCDRAVVGRAEGHAVVVDVRVEGEDLEAARVGEEVAAEAG